MKNQKGVTMMELVIVLIIILLITTFAVYTGKDSIDQAVATEVYNEMNSMKNIVNGINIKQDLNENFSYISGEHYDFKVSELASTIEEFENAYNIDIDENDFENLYIIVGMDNLLEYEKSEVRKYYGLDSIKHSYLVNFKESEVELLKSITIANRNVRTFEQVRALVDDGEI